MHTSQGRVLKEDDDWKYEYHHRDHLGNLRLAVRHEKYTDEYLATMEDSLEKTVFENWDTTRSTIKPSHGIHSSHTNGAEGKEVGLYKVLTVRAGDSLDVKVLFQVDWASAEGYYTHYNSGIPFSTLELPTSNEGGSGLSTNSVTVTVANTENYGTFILQAYLMILYVDDKGNYLNLGSQVSFIYHPPVSLPHWNRHIITKVPPGAVKAYIYVANETPANIYFDDFSIKHTKAIKVIQENHFYPFGMSMKGLELRGNPDHKFKFNGIERVENFELNWDMALYRSYDQILGLWGQIDPKYNYFQSVYSGFGNNPLRYVDPLGDTISIHYGDNQTLQYNQGLKYNGDNAFVSSVVNALNSVGNSKAGGTVLNTLIASEQNYSYINEYSKDKNGNDLKGTFRYVTNGNRKGGTIFAGALFEYGAPSKIISPIAHESFHAYQDENNGFSNGHHIGLEVEATLFGAASYYNYLVDQGQNLDLILISTLNLITGGNNDDAYKKYSTAMIDLLLKPYDQQYFSSAVNNFHLGASKGKIYSKVPVKDYQSPLIRQLYPLLKQ